MSQLFERRMIMSNAKRRDNKGRVLQMGELQQDDGRYVYRYMTPFGQRKAVYSWHLTASDPTPTGKRKEKSLREKIKDIEKQLRIETFWTEKDCEYQNIGCKDFSD